MDFFNITNMENGFDATHAFIQLQATYMSQSNQFQQLFLIVSTPEGQEEYLFGQLPLPDHTSMHVYIILSHSGTHK